MEKVTELGKFLRILRINTGETAQQMSAKLGISASYLSTIENGKRNVPPDLEETVIAKYNLTDKEKEKLKNVVVKSTEMVKIDLTELPENKRHVIFELTKNEALDDDTVDSILEFIAKKKEDTKKDVRFI